MTEDLTGTEVKTSKPLTEKTRQSKKAKRVPKDPLFKELISLYFTDHSLTDFTINPGLQVGQTQLEIDVAVRAAETLTHEEIQTRLKDTPFFFFAYLNVLEFKSANDKLDLADFYRTACPCLTGGGRLLRTPSQRSGQRQEIRETRQKAAATSASG